MSSHPFKPTTSRESPSLLSHAPLTPTPTTPFIYITGENTFIELNASLWQVMEAAVHPLYDFIKRFQTLIEQISGTSCGKFTL